MGTIKVNGLLLDITQYDDEESIVMRYASKQGNIPGYFSLAEKFSKKQKDYSIISVEEELRSIRVEEFSQKGVLSKLSILFPKMTQEQFVYEWVTIFGLPKDIEPFRNLNRYLFPSLETLERNVKEYQTNKGSRIREATESLERRINLFEQLEENKPEKRGEQISMAYFDVSSVILSLAILLPDRDGLYEIFDKMIVSPIIPFIVLVSGSRIYTKVYSHITPPIDWINRTKTQEGVYFYILHTPEQNSHTKITRIMEGAGNFYDEESVIVNRHYSKGVWTPENRVEFEISTEESKKTDAKIEETVLERFRNSFEDLSFEIIAKNYSRIKGVALMKGIDFFLLPFADKVTVDTFFREFLFFNEVTKTVSHRSKPTVLFSWSPPDQKSFSSSIIINIDAAVQGQITLKLMRSRTRRSAKVALKALQVLFQISQNEKERIYSDYSKLLGPKSLPQTKFRQKKMGKNIGPRAIALQNARPDLFVQGYPSSCGKEKQPKLMSKKEADIYIAGFVKKGFDPELAKHKVINYPLGSEDYYSCDPRDDDDKNFYHIWPGIQTNKLITNKENQPFLPCCFVEDQYAKTNSLWNRYLTSVKDSKALVSIQKTVKGYVFGADKSVELGRVGKVPHYISELAKVFDTDLVRLPVDHSPDSFLKCILFALGKYTPREGGNTTAERKKIAKGSLSPLKQTLYEYEESALQELLKSKESYIDPDVFLPLLQLFYKVNIVLFEVSKRHPGGKIIIPRHHPYTKYLQVPKDYPLVMVVKYDSVPPKQHDLQSMLKREEYPFQCELIAMLKKENEEDDKKYEKAKKMLKKDHPFALAMQKAFAAVNSVEEIFSAPFNPIVPENYAEMYRKLERGGATIVAQEIDEFGKCRVLWAEGGAPSALPIFTTALPPLLLPERKYKGEVWKKKSALGFIKNVKGKLLGQDGIRTQEIIQGFWADIGTPCYLPLKPGDSYEPKVQFLERPDPKRVDAISELQEFQVMKKLAEYLLQYSYFAFSLFYLALSSEEKDQEHEILVKAFFSQKVKIIEGYEYPSQLEKVARKLDRNGPFFSQGKLVVSSEVVAEKLQSMLLTALLNDQEYVYNFSTKGVVDLSYSRITDFIERSSQVLFLTERSLLQWRDKKRLFVDALGDSLTRTVYSIVLPQNTKHPYFFKHFALGAERLVLLQNVLGGSLERATSVSRKWVEKRYNPGYLAKTSTKIEGKAMIYSLTGLIREGNYPVLEMPTEHGDIFYVAVLYI